MSAKIGGLILSRDIRIEEVDNGFVIRISEADSGNFFEEETPEFIANNPDEVRAVVEKWLTNNTASIKKDTVEENTLLTRGE